jgi:hypothetical protein
MGGFAIFLWGFFNGIATLVGGATYLYIAMNSGPSEANKRSQEAQDEETKKTTAKILESMGIRPEEVEKLAAAQTVKPAPAPGTEDTPKHAALRDADHNKALDDGKCVYKAAWSLRGSF